MKVHVKPRRVHRLTLNFFTRAFLFFFLAFFFLRRRRFFFLAFFRV